MSELNYEVVRREANRGMREVPPPTGAVRIIAHQHDGTTLLSQWFADGTRPDRDWETTS